MQRLAARGRPDGHLADGRGIACYDGIDVRLLREPEAAADSAWVRFIDGQRPRSHLVLAHLRHATQGDVALANTQPFLRELGGRRHVFAHNGMLPGIEPALGRTCRRFRPIGTTDSELAFCALLEQLAPLWADGVPGLAARRDVVTRFAAALRALGPANFLRADGDLLFAHGHRRTQADGRIGPPGLTLRQRACPVDHDALRAAGVALDPPRRPQVLTLFASVPLIDEPWRALAEGKIFVVRDGAPQHFVEAVP